MPKAAIITLHTVSNYGSCLQTYATQTLFEALGYEVEIVDYYRKDNLPENAVEKAFNGRRLSRYRHLFERLPFLKTVASAPMRAIVNYQRRSFEDFRCRYLNLSKRMYRSAEELEQNPPQADLYVTGSDQVWNSVWNCGFETPFYLTFAPEGKKRISFAASIGRESIDDWERPLMVSALSKYDAISMREMSGVAILQDLGFAETELVLDPTLMLDKAAWSEIATMPRGVQGPYILVYQLNKSPEFEEYCRLVAKTYNMPLVKISYGIYDIMKGGKTLIAPPVTDFVGLFLNASYVITDSFHATAYALNFGIPFTAIAPERFSTRIRSILALTGTEHRLLVDYSDPSLFQDDIDFDRVEEALRKQRNSSMAFLEEAIGAK
ncbi:polysaccharide pyruvyl transferase family protein [Caniella muris]|uniref:polysaccharide pyruvyl transferase family protein n=1 Tax=Caniella muris TaxID=2941502 RepID=UPI0020423CB1|nr:polysaccharide pyruvyl transferase family protein [Caniella muris]